MTRCLSTEPRHIKKNTQKSISTRHFSKNETQEYRNHQAGPWVDVK